MKKLIGFLIVLAPVLITGCRDLDGNVKGRIGGEKSTTTLSSTSDSQQTTTTAVVATPAFAASAGGATILSGARGSFLFLPVSFVNYGTETIPADYRLNVRVLMGYTTTFESTRYISSAFTTTVGNVSVDGIATGETGLLAQNDAGDPEAAGNGLFTETVSFQLPTDALPGTYGAQVCFDILDDQSSPQTVFKGTGNDCIYHSVTIQ